MNDILPIEHLSYSALKTLCSNPWAFKKQYILGIWDFKQSMTAFIGEAAHRALQAYYSGEPLEIAIKYGLQLMDNTPDLKLNFGKTGSRKKAIEDFNTAVNFFMQERPEVGEVVGVEKMVTTYFEIDGVRAPLPIKAKTDLVSRLDGKLWLWDWKFVSAFSDKNTEKSDFIMQAMFNYHTVTCDLKEPPVGMRFVEVKKSKNKDGASQVEVYEIVYDKHPEYFTIFNRIYIGAIQLLSLPDLVFLPNFGDTFTGADAWIDFMQNHMDMEMPAQVTHKSPVTVNVERRYVESTVSAPSADVLKPEEKIAAKLQEFGIPVQFQEKHEGANVTIYTFLPSRGITMAQIKKYEDDLALALESKSVRIEAPMRGTKFVGVEVANTEQKIVTYDEGLIHTDSLDIPVGQDVFGKAYYLDLAKAPHLLIAGTTGSGKSIFLNMLIATLIRQNSPEQMQLILIDPKMTELTMFENDPHLLTDVITEAEQAESSLRWAVIEMERRYELFKNMKVRDIDTYTKTAPMSKIVIVIDEFADLKMNPDTTQIESLLIRLAQKSRAAGIHLVVATQRPSVDVVTGVMKANFPTRVGFMTSTKTDSMVILDQVGAEQLLGNGDLLLMSASEKGLVRLQGYYFK